MIMDFYDVIRNRRSVRSYRDRPVEEEKRVRLREAVRLAPTACNYQPFCFLEIVGPEAREAVAACYPREWFGRAPMYYVAVADPQVAWSRKNGNSSYEIDAAIAMEHLVLAATAEGLATCWICAFDQEELHRALELPAEVVPVAMTPVGYRDGDLPPLPPRKTVDELFRRL